MKSTAAKSFWVGVVALIAISVAAAGILVIGAEQKLWEGHNLYLIRFSRTDGLQESAPVTLHGLNVGTVKRMRFPDDPDTTYVDVTLSISSAIASRIREDTVGRLQTYGLLGNKYVELIGGTVDSPILEPGGLLKSIEPVDYEAILNRSGDIVSNVIEVTALLKELLIAINRGDGLIGRLVKDEQFGKEFLSRTHGAVASLEAAAERMRSASGRLDDILASAQAGHGALGVLLTDEESMREVLGAVRSASADAAALAEELRHGQGLLRTLATDQELAREVENAVGDLARASANAADVSEQIRSGEGTLGKLVYDDELYKQTEGFFGGATAGFWKLLLRPLKFLWPFPSQETPPEGASEPPAPAATDPLQAAPIPGMHDEKPRGDSKGGTGITASQSTRELGGEMAGQ